MQDDPYYLFWRRHWVAVVCAVASCIMLLNVWLWHTYIQTNPQRTFWATISQHLATSSVTVSAAQSDKNNKLKQTVSLSLGAQNAAHARVHVTQGDTSIVTEVIGTPTADYTRYVSIKGGTPMANAEGVTNVWAKSDPLLFGQSTLGIGLSLGSVPVPIANAHGAARDMLMKQIKDRSLYRVAFADVKKERVNGRLLYTYTVESAPFVYVEVMQLIARQIGVKSLEKIEPGEYRDLETIKMRFTVDVRARHITQVTYSGSAYTQVYSAYDVPVTARIPAKTIPMAELQKRLQPKAQQ